MTGFHLQSLVARGDARLPFLQFLLGHGQSKVPLDKLRVGIDAAPGRPGHGRPLSQLFVTGGQIAPIRGLGRIHLRRTFVMGQGGTIIARLIKFIARLLFFVGVGVDGKIPFLALAFLLQVILRPLLQLQQVRMTGFHLQSLVARGDARLPFLQFLLGHGQSKVPLDKLRVGIDAAPGRPGHGRPLSQLFVTGGQIAPVRRHCGIQLRGALIMRQGRRVAARLKIAVARFLFGVRLRLRVGGGGWRSGCCRRCGCRWGCGGTSRGIVVVGVVVDIVRFVRFGTRGIVHGRIILVIILVVVVVLLLAVVATLFRFLLLLLLGRRFLLCLFLFLLFGFRFGRRFLIIVVVDRWRRRGWIDLVVGSFLDNNLGAQSRQFDRGGIDGQTRVARLDALLELTLPSLGCGQSQVPLDKLRVGRQTVAGRRFHLTRVVQHFVTRRQVGMELGAVRAPVVIVIVMLVEFPERLPVLSNGVLVPAGLEIPVALLLERFRRFQQRGRRFVVVVVVVARLVGHDDDCDFLCDWGRFDGSRFVDGGKLTDLLVDFLVLLLADFLVPVNRFRRRCRSCRDRLLG